MTVAHTEASDEEPNPHLCIEALDDRPACFLSVALANVGIDGELSQGLEEFIVVPRN
jgi:hypothetical protein